MSLYTIIKQLQAASGSNAKTAILEANKDNELLKAYLKAVYDPSINYYQTKCPKYKKSLPHRDSLIEGRLEDLDKLSKRVVTGSAAIDYLQHLLERDSMEGQELIELLIKRSIGAGVGDTMILKVFPNLWFSVPYQRCSLMDGKIKAKFEKQDKFYVQLKYDSSFAYAGKEQSQGWLITRAGSKYPADISNLITRDIPAGHVLMGELEVLEDGKILDRKTGCGVLNSLLKGGELEKRQTLQLTAWDVISIDDFKNGVSKIPYKDRLKKLESFYDKQ